MGEPGDAARRRGAPDPAEPIALVAAAKRDVLLRVHRHRLRREDLEDCYSQATLELIVLARRGRAFASRVHVANSLAQDYVSWGDPGPGRWVTIYATDVPTPHVFATIAGLRIDTSHNGTDTGPNRNQDGPRWRLFGEIPGWAHWSIRHPPGL
jgi:hypothetical protein